MNLGLNSNRTSHVHRASPSWLWKRALSKYQRFFPFLKLTTRKPWLVCFCHFSTLTFCYFYACMGQFGFLIRHCQSVCIFMFPCLSTIHHIFKSEFIWHVISYNCCMIHSFIAYGLTSLSFFSWVTFQAQLGFFTTTSLGYNSFLSPCHSRSSCCECSWPTCMWIHTHAQLRMSP